MKFFFTWRFFLFINFLFFTTIIQAHKGAIRGSLVDSVSGEVIPGAIVYILEKNLVTSTDEMGNFNFKDLNAGDYHLKFSSLGYRSKTVHASVNESEPTFLKIRFAISSIDLSEVVVEQNGLPNAVSPLSKIDLSLRPFRSSQDILRIVPGLVTAQHAGGGKAEQIFLRGFDIDHGTDIRLTVDGVPVNMVSHAHGQGYADLHFLTPELIDRIDFNKGPYYAEHGDFTTAGYAEFKTKNSLPGSSLRMEAGRFNSFRNVGMFNLLDEKMKAKNQNAFLVTEYMYTDGYFESPQNFNRINITGKYHGAVAENKLLTVSLSTFRSKWEASGQIPQRAVNNKIISRFGAIDNKEGGNTERSNVNLMLCTVNDKGAVIKNQIYYSNYSFELFSNFTFFLDDSINGDQIKQKEQRNIYGYNTSIEKWNTFRGLKTRSSAGLQLRYDDINNSELSHTAQRKRVVQPLAFGQTDQINVGLFVDETIFLTQKLSINTALRFDQFLFEHVNELDSFYSRSTAAKHIFSPKLNLTYSINKNLQIYLKGGTGFHSNDARVVVKEKNNTTLPRGAGADAGFFLKPNSRLLLNAAVFTLHLEQEFVYVGDAAIVEASGVTIRRGVDISARYQVLDWLFLDMDANYTKGRFTGVKEGQNFIPLAPAVTAVSGISFKLKNGFSGSLRYRYVGDRPANESNSVVAEGYQLFDVVLNYTQKKFQISISAENLLNSEWNEAQFDTESRLRNETAPVSELHFTPGSPLFLKGGITWFF